MASRHVTRIVPRNATLLARVTARDAAGTEITIRHHESGIARIKPTRWVSITETGRNGFLRHVDVLEYTGSTLPDAATDYTRMAADLGQLPDFDITSRYPYVPAGVR